MPFLLFRTQTILSMREEDLLDNQAKVKPDFKEFDFPIDFRFKLGTISNDFVATDANGRTLAYVRQKMFKLKTVKQICCIKLVLTASSILMQVMNFRMQMVLFWEVLVEKECVHFGKHNMKFSILRKNKNTRFGKKILGQRYSMFY